MTAAVDFSNGLSIRKNCMPKVGGKNIEVLFSAETIAERNLELAKAIVARNFENLLVISILKGSFIFAADLIRAMHDAGAEPDVEFITVSSYGKGTESTEVRLLRDIDSDVHGRDVLLIDDILESGKTLKFTRELMLQRGARSVSIAVLLDKSVKRKTDIEADFKGFECPDYFVVGYGMDVGHSFRQLPYVGVVTD
jgi:hypoxanthine phosphoribosyltransferase